jgi:hypothetical protein
MALDVVAELGRACQSIGCSRTRGHASSCQALEALDDVSQLGRRGFGHSTSNDDMPPFRDGGACVRYAVVRIE